MSIVRLVALLIGTASAFVIVTDYLNSPARRPQLTAAERAEIEARYEAGRAAAKRQLAPFDAELDRIEMRIERTRRLIDLSQDLSDGY